MTTKIQMTAGRYAQLRAQGEQAKRDGIQSFRAAVAREFAKKRAVTK